jgi:predicted unusual protein kinase regulating ubiquinone biosynthesis (AarF/ABC1/UbiB family)
VLVTEFVPSAGFGAMREHPEADRDRYAEVIHRFFHDTAGRLGVALGDPHPGNVLLAEDGRLAFIDFGMLRQLPREYMEREGDVYRALRAEDRAGLRRTLGALGYLPEPWPHPDELLFQYMRRAAAWMIDPPQPRRLGPATTAEIMESIFALGPDWLKMVKAFSLPSEAVLLRRMENMVFGVCADLRAEADWRALADELLAREEPRTALGREHAAWVAGGRG